MKIQAVPVLALALLAGCAPARPTNQVMAPAGTPNPDVLAQLNYERSTVANFPCPAGKDAQRRCQGKQLGMIVPMECGGKIEPGNLAWFDDDGVVKVKQLQAQCIMQHNLADEAAGAQYRAALMYQQQMENALLYNDLTRVMGSGLYQMSK